MKNLRFEFSVYTEDGDCLAAEWTTIPDIEYLDQYGGCESVDLHVSSVLRAIKRDADAIARKSVIQNEWEV